MKTKLEKLIAASTPGELHVMSDRRSLAEIHGVHLLTVLDRGSETPSPEANARRLALFWNHGPKLVAALGVMTQLCRIKYGNLEPDVYAEIEKSEALLMEIEKQAGEL